MITIRNNRYTLEDIKYLLDILSEKSGRSTCEYSSLYSCDSCPCKKVCVDMRYTLNHLIESYESKLHKTTL